MRGSFCRLVLVGILLVSCGPARLFAGELWQSPFDTTVAPVSSNSADALTLDAVLDLVARGNPHLRALQARNQASQGLLRQARLWSNPEIGFYAEVVGWDAPGLAESELNVSLSQELELFGQRAARTRYAETQIDATQLQTRMAAFDLYTEVKMRFYALVHARRQLELAERTLSLADDIVANIEFRIDKGAALQSELLLAELELNRARLSVDEARQAFLSTTALLAAMWQGAPDSLDVVASLEPSLSDVISTVSALRDRLDSSRTLLQLRQDAMLLQVERSLAVAEARPPITVSGGFKRLEVDNSMSFLFGVSMPLPFVNRNQGVRQRLAAEVRAVEYDAQRARLETRARLQTHVQRLGQLVERHTRLDSVLLPIAEEAYTTLQGAYEAGRVPYTQLLEAERSLNSLHFEHNDMLFEIHREVISVETLTGVTLRFDQE